MEEISFGPDLLIPAQRSADAGVPRQKACRDGRRRRSARAVLVDVPAWPDRVAPADFDPARLPKPVLLALEVAIAAGAGIAAGLLVNLTWWRLALIGAMTLVVHYYSGVEAIRPGLPTVHPPAVVRPRCRSAWWRSAWAFLHVHQEVLRDAGVVIFTRDRGGRAGLDGPAPAAGTGPAGRDGQPDDHRAARPPVGPVDHRAKVVGGVVVDRDASEPSPGTEGDPARPRGARHRRRSPTGSTAQRADVVGRRARSRRHQRARAAPGLAAGGRPRRDQPAVAAGLTSRPTGSTPPSSPAPP